MSLAVLAMPTPLASCTRARSVFSGSTGRPRRLHTMPVLDVNLSSHSIAWAQAHVARKSLLFSNAFDDLVVLDAFVKTGKGCDRTRFDHSFADVVASECTNSLDRMPLG